MCSSFKENRKTLSRESVKQDTKENQIIDRKGKLTLSTRRGKNPRNGVWKRGRQSRGADLGILVGLLRGGVNQ
jgi:hypothetical protein